MESRISLALATKLRNIFEKEDKYLTFPLGMGFTYRYLNFMKDPSISGLTLQEQLNNKGDFARLLNIVPSDATPFSQDASRFLWDELINVLKVSTFAKSNLSVAENNLLNEAIDFLTDVKKEDGTEIPVNSVIVDRYYRYKTIFDQAEVAYLNEKMTVELSTGTEGEKLKQQWKMYREKQLLDIKNKAEEDWRNLGLREQVKYYQQVRSDLEPKKFLGLYRSAYLNEIGVSEIPDLNGMGIGVCTTFFSPSDAFELNLPWMEFTLSKEEINQLVRTSQSDLKSVFNAEEGSHDIESVKLEYKEVVIIRPWYKPEFFASRCWKFDDNTFVSDGHVPRQGKIPAYITSMLVVRNVIITRRKTAQPTPLVLPILTRTPIQTLKIKDFQGRASSIDVQRPLVEVSRSKFGGIQRIELFEKPQSRFEGIPRKATVQQPMAVKTKFPGSSVSSTERSSFISASTQEISEELSLDQSRALLLKQRMSYINTKYAGTTIKSPTVEVPKRNELPGNQNTGEQFVTETFGFDGVIVLAYICKRVPKSPDPDLALVWT